VNQPLSRVLIDEQLPATYLAASRLMALAAVFGGWMFVWHRRSLPRGRTLAMLAVYGVVGFAVLQWSLTEAIARIDVGVVLTFAYAASFPTALWCLLVRGERQPPVIWGAMLVALAGIVLALGLGGDTLSALPVSGVVFSVAVCLLFAYYALHGEVLMRTTPTPVILGVASIFAAVAWTLTAAPIWEFPTAVITEPVSLGGNLADVELPGAFVLGWSVLVGTALPYVLYLVGIGRVGPTRGVLQGTIEPVIAVVVAWLWIDQRLTPLQLVGCAIVFVAVAAVQMARVRAPTMA
jgi:drug/metabolite transporter (DMT)-like permease